MHQVDCQMPQSQLLLAPGEAIKLLTGRGWQSFASRRSRALSRVQLRGNQNPSTRYRARSTVYDRQQHGATIGQPTRFDMHKLAMLIQVFPPITFLQKLFRFFTTFVEINDHDYGSLQVFPDDPLTGLIGGRENPA